MITDSRLGSAVSTWTEHRHERSHALILTHFGGTVLASRVGTSTRNCPSVLMTEMSLHSPRCQQQ